MKEQEFRTGQPWQPQPMDEAGNVQPGADEAVKSDTLENYQVILRTRDGRMAQVGEPTKIQADAIAQAEQLLIDSDLPHQAFVVRVTAAFHKDVSVKRLF